METIKKKKKKEEWKCKVNIFEKEFKTKHWRVLESSKDANINERRKNNIKKAVG